MKQSRELPTPDQEFKNVRVFDMRSSQAAVPPHARIRNGIAVRRGAATITGIVLHQTAVDFDVPRDLLKKHGDEDAALAERSLKVACHAIAFQRGLVVITNHPTMYINQANRLNATTLGIEIEGKYPGLESQAKGSYSRKMSTTIEAGRKAILELASLARSAGCPLKYIYAHRQSSGSRRADPGEWLWKELAPFAETRVGLAPMLDYVIDDGRPIPSQWDSRATATY